MARITVQIYEIQDPWEAEKMIKLGVDHLGSVIINEKNWRVHSIKETVRITEGTAAKNSLIPLFNTPDTVFRALEYYNPYIIHFCETLTDEDGKTIPYNDLIGLQRSVKEKFPHIKIMRSIPIGVSGKPNGVPTLEIANDFEPVRDYFRTDTWLGKEPVEGFIGITGKTCDWDAARALVQASSIPVFLAGGMSPENVYNGIKAVRPFGVDSCTNTNETDGNGKPIRFKKDCGKVKKFVEEAQRAITKS
jgi:phosphoribosylanthranilate isomerase